MLLRSPLAVLLLVGGILSAGEEKLVPAQFNPRNDTAGTNWDIQPNGCIGDGSNDCFDNGAVLLVSAREIQFRDQKQTQDGAELVLSGNVPKATVIRRILVDAPRQAARYLEIVTNTTPQKIQVVLEVRSRLGDTPAQLVWNDGKPAVSGPLPKKCVALAAIHQPNNGRPGVVWIIGDTRASVPPTVEIRDQRMVVVRYTMDLAPQQSRTVLHYVLQRQGLQAAQLNETIKPLWRHALVKPAIPTAYKRLLSNFPTGTASADEEADETPRLPVIAALLERAGVTDTAGKDLVGVGRSEAERMTGLLSGGPLAITTEFGPLTIPVAELAGAESGGFRTLVHLRTGETLTTGNIKGALRLETEAGVDLPVEPAQVAWVVAKRSPTDGVVPADQVGVLLLTDGSRIAVRASAPALPLISACGRAAVAFDQFATIERMTEPPSWLALMRDGSRLRVLPAAKEITVLTCRYGSLVVPTARIAGYLMSGKLPNMDEEREDGAVLDSGERFQGGLAGPTLTILANGTETAVPVERITAIERPEDSAGNTLALALRDGGRLVGTSKDGSVAFTAGGQIWHVPAHRLMQWQAPKPPEPPEKEEPDDAPAKDKDGDKPGATPPPSSANGAATPAENPFATPEPQEQP
jgi:hypothetical protein